MTVLAVGIRQRAGALAIPGGLRTSPTDALGAHAFLLPMPLKLGNWLNRKIAGNTTKPHKSINALLATYGHNLKRFEKIPATARDPSQSGKLPFAIPIADSRENSTKDAESATEDINLNADSSAINGKVGAAAVLMRTGNPPPILHLRFGPESKHTVHEAELAGILLGMRLISTEKHGSTTFAIGVGYQATIKAFHAPLRSPGHHLAWEAIRIANQVRKSRSKCRYGLTLQLIVDFGTVFFDLS